MKPSFLRDRRVFDSFESHLRWVQGATALKLGETEKVREDRRKRARTDYRYFVSEYFPHYATAECADFHVDAARTLLKYPNLRMPMAWFRGAAKSVHADIFYPMWLKIQPQRQLNTMVLVSKSYDQATQLLSDLQAELQGNLKYLADYGEQVRMGSWEEGGFVTADGVGFHALGLGQSPRGLREGPHRPDYIVLDDIDDDQAVLNAERTRRTLSWIIKALIPTMDTGRGRVVIANNIIHERSITAQLIDKYRDIRQNLRQNGQSLTSTDNTHYHVSIVNIRDDKGRLAWPQKHTEQMVADFELELGYAAAQTELYNNPISEGAIFQRDWFQFKELPDLRKYTDLVSYYDGGYKKTATSDSKSLVLMGLLNGEYHVIKVWCGKATRMEAVGWHYELHEYLKRNNATCRWYMEEKFMLDLLYEDFKEAAKERGFPIPLMGDKRNKPDKDLRIQATSGAWERGSCYLNKAESANHHMKHFVEQYLAFAPGKNTLKDGPDAAEGCMHLLQERVRTSSPPVSGTRRGGGYRY